MNSKLKVVYQKYEWLKIVKHIVHMTIHAHFFFRGKPRTQAGTNEGMMIVNDNEKLGRKMFPLSAEFFLLSMQNKIIIYQKLIYAKHKKY